MSPPLQELGMPGPTVAVEPIDRDLWTSRHPIFVALHMAIVIAWHLH